MGQNSHDEQNPALTPSRVVSRILGNITHELKTPLHSMLALAQLLESETDGTLNSEQRKQVEMIIRNGESLLELITQLLTYSSLESGAQRAVFEEFAPAPLLHDLVQTIDPLAAKQGIRIDADITKVTGSIVSDPRLVRQCLSNLLGNALKFSPANTTLSVFAASLQDGSLLVEFADSGVGIPLEMKDRIFEEFVQVENRDSRRYGGAGLGLALVRTALELLGGTVQVRSEVGQGSLFRVTIPSRVERLQQPHIFVAERDFNVSTTLHECLRRIGCQADFVTSPEEALERARQTPPSMLIVGSSDSGPVAIDVLRYRNALSGSDQHNAPILALSSYDRAGDRAEALSAGAADYLVKPFAVDELMSRVRALLPNSNVTGPT